MKSLFAAMRQDSSVAQIESRFAGKKGQTLIYGLAGSQKHAIFASCYDKTPRTTIIITHDHDALEAWRDDLFALLPEVKILELPETDLMNVSAEVRGVELAAKRMNVLGCLARHEPIIVLAQASAAVQPEMAVNDFERLSLQIHLGDQLGRENLLEYLVRLGYESSPEVESMGQFSARGGIVDVYPINASAPIRIEFFDDEVDSLREFDLSSRRSSGNIEVASILPLAQIDENGKPAVFLSYLKGQGVVVFDEPIRIREQAMKLIKENPELKKKLFSWEMMLDATADDNVIFSALMLQKVHHAEPEELISVVVKTVAPFQRQMDLLQSEIRDRLAQKERVIVLMGNGKKADSIHETFARNRIPSSVRKPGELIDGRFANIIEGTLLNGFELPGAHLVIIAEKDILGRQKKRMIQKVSSGQKISHFREINVGDYVVHVNHGIGKYLGVVTMDVGGIKRDYLHIKYGGDDKLFVPTDQVHLLQKYIGSEGEVPRLHRMGGTEWAKAKAKARSSVEDIAKDLIALYAKRREAQGFAFSPDTPWQEEFEEAFPYAETTDQLQATVEIKRDMEKSQPMDRLLCGDVGFGKTEVAVRAAFKAVMSGKQVAVLVPTTVLAQQHYQTFTARFHDFGPTVDVICRFRTAKEQKDTLQQAEAGKIDILIGTHAILNQRRVKFKNLGLLIVDEEQRFGVKQKEKIKKLAAGIDVLTLSATPIPRTLHMSLVGARDMSIIETPPAERFPVQTYVVENNDGIIASAVKREMKRGGQIYFVYNRVATIDKMREHLQSIVPEARIQVAHGQMPEEILERVMMEFYEGKYDILLATSIVENGLDVANANTIIVYDADHFGLSQLYQMRGRVGRSNHMAFAYFVYQADKVLSETAEKRLQAMKEFAELGAGFKIAMRDLEIRGAGNLLGSQQHGHIASVGFEMYCKLLEEAVQALKSGKPVEKKPEPVIELPVDAYIDGGYIEDASHKIEIYQRIAALRTDDEADNLLDELIDRFGEPSPPVLQLLDVARIRNMARKIGIKSVMARNGFIEFSFLAKADYTAESFAQLMQIYGSSLKVIMHPSQIMRVRVSPLVKKNITGAVRRFLAVLSGQKATVQKTERMRKEA
jgi:transcription-repair coupling factor (superfamily II helicase)